MPLLNLPPSYDIESGNDAATTAALRGLSEIPFIDMTGALQDTSASYFKSFSQHG